MIYKTRTILFYTCLIIIILFKYIYLLQKLDINDKSAIFIKTESDVL